MNSTSTPAPHAISGEINYLPKALSITAFV